MHFAHITWLKKNYFPFPVYACLPLPKMLSTFHFYAKKSSLSLKAHSKVSSLCAGLVFICHHTPTLYSSLSRSVPPNCISWLPFLQLGFGLGLWEVSAGDHCLGIHSPPLTLSFLSCITSAASAPLQHPLFHGTSSQGGSCDLALCPAHSGSTW